MTKLFKDLIILKMYVLLMHGHYCNKSGDSLIIYTRFEINSSKQEKNHFEGKILIIFLHVSLTYVVATQLKRTIS